MERDLGTLVGNASTTTIGEVLDEWLQIEAPRGVAPENLVQYEQTIRLHLKPALGNVRVQKLTTQQIETLLADMRAAGKSASLIIKTLQRLKSALKLAQRWGLIHTNPAEHVKAPMAPSKPPAVWTPSQIASFLTEARAESAQHHLYFLLRSKPAPATSCSACPGPTWIGSEVRCGSGGEPCRPTAGTPVRQAAGQKHRRLTHCKGAGNHPGGIEALPCRVDAQATRRRGVAEPGRVAPLLPPRADRSPT